MRVRLLSSLNVAWNFSVRACPRHILRDNKSQFPIAVVYNVTKFIDEVYGHLEPRPTVILTIFIAPGRRRGDPGRGWYVAISTQFTSAFLARNRLRAYSALNPTQDKTRLRPLRTSVTPTRPVLCFPRCTSVTSSRTQYVSFLLPRLLK